MIISDDQALKITTTMKVKYIMLRVRQINAKVVSCGLMATKITLVGKQFLELAIYMNFLAPFSIKAQRHYLRERY